MGIKMLAMQLEQRTVTPITNPESLPDLIRVAIARAKHLGQPIILSYTLAWQHIDPLAFLAAKSEVGQHKFYWQQPDQGLTLAAGGMVATISENVATIVKPTLRFDLAKQFAQHYLVHAVVGGEPSAIAYGIPSPYVLGGFAFHDVRSQQTWHGFPAVMMYVPCWLMRQTDADSSLMVNHCVYPQDEPEVIESYLERLIAYLRQDFKPSELCGARFPEGCIPPSASRVVDRFKYQSKDRSSAVVIEEIVGDRPWAEIVQQAVDCIKLGKLDKVVLSRALEVTARHNYEAIEVLDRLRQSYPECITFLIDFGIGTAFLGATPEMLLKFQTCNNRLLLSSDALAGSIGRSQTVGEDLDLGDRLLHSSKDLGEHEIVIKSICDCLHKIGADLHPIEPPKLLKLSNVQHLYTPIAAELANTSWLTAFDVLEQLHPTAAVGGDPKATALHLMREWEVCDRGWYAAPIGWVNGNGEGAFAVGIRSGYLSNNKARIYAGAGIVSDSQFDAELDETAIKFEALLQALAASQK
ncbi:MAG: isochorismate synthase [Pseudanabaena sp. SU_2_4]|nr:isochorismate synthase [Pseudanabaena sp. SU_2_4]